MVSSEAKYFIIRLRPHQDLKRALIDFARQNNISAGAIVTCVGSLEQYHLRFANAKAGEKAAGFFEIVSMTGTLNADSCHLHLAISDTTGQTIGGHLLDDNLIYTTAEIAIVSFDDLRFDRETDSTYGYKELIVTKSRL